MHLALERGGAKFLKYSSSLGFSYSVIEQKQLDAWGLYNEKSLKVTLFAIKVL